MQPKLLSAGRTSSPRARVLVFILVLLVAIVLRIAGLRSESVDGDELFSRRMAILPVAAAISEIQKDLVHPPLYYLLLKVGTAMWGSNALGIRLLSLVFGIATIVCVATFRRQSPELRLPAMLAAAMIALNENHIFFSQYARPYALYALLVTLLLLWLCGIEKRQDEVSFWVVGATLMTALLYTSYVGTLYVGCMIAAILICDLPRKVKQRAVFACTVAVCLFVPWLIALSDVYKAKGGLNQNLGWQGLPTLYDFRSVWAQFIGVPNFRGATTVSLIIGFGFSIAFLATYQREKQMAANWYVVAFALTALLPPFVLFGLTLKPFGLPIFALRQLLPSVIPFCLLCCCGLQRLAGWFALRRHILSVGAVALLVASLVPTIDTTVHPPRRFPYAAIARDIENSTINGWHVYTTYPYGVGEPVNFYSGRQLVDPLPISQKLLPDELVLLYRPSAAIERQKFNELVAAGYRTFGSKYYSTGKGSEWGTRLVCVGHVLGTHDGIPYLPSVCGEQWVGTRPP